MKGRIGPLEIGIFGSSCVVLGLIIWFLTLTFFGSRNHSEAKPIVVLGPTEAALKAVSGHVQPQLLSQPPKEQVMPKESKPTQQEPEQQQPPALPTPPAPLEQGLTQAPQPPVLPQPEPKPAALTKSEPEIPKTLQALPVETPGFPLEALPQASTASPLVEPVMPRQPIEPQASAQPLPPAEETKAAQLTQKDETERVEFKPASLRDPTLSPDEMRAIASRKKKLEMKTEKQQDQAVKARRADLVGAVKRKIEVQGVLNTEDGILAIINNQILKKGDEIFGARILQILGSRVIFKYQNNVFEKRVKQ